MLEGSKMLVLDRVHPIDHVPVNFLCAWWRRERASVDEAVASSRQVHELAIG